MNDGTRAVSGEGSATTFPFGVVPDADDDAPEPTRSDARGPDTANRLLLHGARHHDRDAVFLHWGRGLGGGTWQATPDWRADRAALRAALALGQRLEVAEGDRVALWLGLGPEWAEIERAVWSIGAVSVPVWPEWPVERVAAVLAESGPEVLFVPSTAAARELEGIGGRPETLRAIICLESEPDAADEWLRFERFLEGGAVLDTAERASMWRTLARRVGPDAPATLEFERSGDEVPGETFAGRARPVTQRELVAAAGRLARRHPPRHGGIRLLATERPDPRSRALLLAGWADGLTRTAFAPAGRASELGRELGADLVAIAGEEEQEPGKRAPGFAG